MLNWWSCPVSHSYSSHCWHSLYILLLPGSMSLETAEMQAYAPHFASSSSPCLLWFTLRDLQSWNVSRWMHTTLWCVGSSSANSCLLKSHAGLAWLALPLSCSSLSLLWPNLSTWHRWSAYFCQVSRLKESILWSDLWQALPLCPLVWAEHRSSTRKGKERVFWSLQEA